MSAFTRAGENGRLTLAVPAKGRMAEPTLRLCADAGLSFETTERSLVVPCANAPVDLLLVRPSDIPEYVQDGVVHLGVTGANLVVEANADVVTLAELGFARCTLQAAVPNDAPQTSIADLDGLRVATAYPVSTKMLLDERGIEAELVPVSGSVEATPRLGLADAIVDLVSTGSTASANGLRLIGTLLSSQAVLIGGRVRRRGAARPRRAPRADALRRRRGSTQALRDDERDDRDAARDSRRAPEHGSAHRARAGRRGGDRRARRCRCRRRVGVAARAPRCRGHLDPRPADRAARAVRGAGLDDAITVAAPIVADVRDRGDAALLEWTERFDGPRPEGFRVSRERIEAAAVPADVLEALRAMIRAVRAFNEAQRPVDTVVEAAPGIVSERRWLPLDAIGICVPSGTFPLPSSLVMAAVPALVAGVRRIAVVTPNPVDVTLVVARELGLDEVYAIGGAQAVAALAYGTESIAAGRPDRRAGKCLRHRCEAPRLEPRRHRSSCRPERGDRDRRRDRGRRRVCRRSSGPGRARAGQRGASPEHRCRAVRARLYTCCSI